MSLKDWLLSWVYLRSSGLAPRTVDSYVSLIRLHLGDLACVQLCELQPGQISARLASICAAGHTRTAQLLYILMHAALAAAVHQGVLPRSPVDMVMRPRHYSTQRAYLCADDLRRFLARSSSSWCVAWHLAAVLGLRRGELCGLQWSDVDFDSQVIHIHQQRLRLADGTVQLAPPKSRAGVRDLPVPPDLLRILSATRTNQVARQLAGALPATWVVATVRNAPVSPSSVNHALKRDLLAAGLPVVPLHGLRHSMATMAMQSGINLRVLQSLLGHSSVTTTAAIYCHVVLSDKREAIAELTRVCYT